MKILLSANVFDAALDRIRWLYDEFPNVVVSWSGGKDSTVILELAIKVAREKGRLPVKCFWIDQEAEWGCVRDFARATMDREEVEPFWLQVPMVIQNGASGIDSWLNCWEPGEEWMREQEPDSIHVNNYGTKRFGKLFNAALEYHFGDQPMANLGGVRSEESPARHLGMTSSPTYKGETWGKKLNEKLGHFTFYPIYDWSYRDVWKAIHDERWPYCKLYDWMWQHGVPLTRMRVSALHHETAVFALHYLHNLERDTWNRASKRIPGIGTVKHLGDEFQPRDMPLPPMFKDWREYRDYLTENLIPVEEHRKLFRKKFAQMDRDFAGMKRIHELYRVQISSLMVNDFGGTKTHNWEVQGPRAAYVKYRRGQHTPEVMRLAARYITG